MHCSDSRQVQVGDCQTLRATVTVGRYRWEMLSDLKGHSDSRQVDRWGMLSDLKGHSDRRQVDRWEMLSDLKGHSDSRQVDRWETVRP